MTDDILDVWQFGREDERAVATVVALDRFSLPDFQVVLLKSYGDAVVIQLLKGGPSGDPDAIFCPERWGSVSSFALRSGRRRQERASRGGSSC